MTHEDGSQPRPIRLGAYDLIRPLAQGGMADIYLARRRGAGEAGPEVALKIYNARRVPDAEGLALFLHEARVCGLLHHPNIPAAFEVAVADGHHYLAMEYVRGVDLREVVEAAGRAKRGIPYAAAISIVAAAAAGLDHAHRGRDADGRPLELVHRDVSLSNIMVCPDGAVKVVDFGIASTTISEVHTLPGVVRGKASYMSPEQCQGERVDRRTDVFALGVVLYELTTGARCFHGRTDFERMLAVVRGDYVPPAARVPGYPAELAEVVATALAPSPDQRYPSCAALLGALERVLVARGWTGGAGPIARLMATLFGAPAGEGASAAEGAGAVAEAATRTGADVGGADAVGADAGDTVRVPPLALAECGAIPYAAVAIAAAPTRPQRRLARGSATAFDAACDAASDAAFDAAPTRGRRALRRRGDVIAPSRLAA